MELQQIERDLLNIVQHDFPLDPCPFTIIAERLGISEEECLERLDDLSRRGILRGIRPVINWKEAGFTGILIGIEADPGCVDEVAEAINTIPGVTHNYLREGRLNLWCTLTFGGPEEKERLISFMARQPGVRDLKEFASEKTYKIGLILDV